MHTKASLAASAPKSAHASIATQRGYLLDRALTRSTGKSHSMPRRMPIGSLRGAARADVALFMPAFVGGGLEAVNITLAQMFAAQGLRVDIVVMKNEGELINTVPSEVRVIDLGTSTFRTSLIRRGRMTVQNAMRKYLESEKPNSVLASNFYCNVCVLMARGRQETSRVVIVTHNMLSKQMQGSKYRTQWLFKCLIWYFYRFADSVVTVSEGVADDLAREAWLERERIRVVYNPVVTPEIAVKAAGQVDHPWFFESEATPVILAAGRLTAQKDFATLLRAFASLRAGRPARLAILGEGPDRAALEALAGALRVDGDVALLGFVANPFAFMARASAFVLSSAWEGFGNVLVEALACGCPVVSTDCRSGPREILEDGRYGRLVPVGAPDAMAAAIAEVLDEPPDKELLRRRASFFSAEQSAACYLELLGLRDANPH